MLHFEEQIPSCFMHGNWDQYRLLWVKAAQACSKVSDFSTVLNVLQNNIKPCVFTACWAESLGEFLYISQVTTVIQVCGQSCKAPSNSNVSQLMSMQVT